MAGIVRQQELGVSRNLNGGVQVRIGNLHFQLPPQEAVKFGTAILREAGVQVEFGNPQLIVAQPQKRGLLS